MPSENGQLLGKRSVCPWGFVLADFVRHGPRISVNLGLGVGLRMLRQGKATQTSKTRSKTQVSNNETWGTPRFLPLDSGPPVRFTRSNVS